MEIQNIREELEFSKQKYELEREVETIFLNEGYTPVEASFFEDYESFCSINKSFKRESLVKILNGYGDVMIVRPDITSNLIKRFIPRYRSGMTLKLFYNATVFSNKIGLNILEHKQVGVEYLGEDNTKADLDVIGLALRVLNQYNKEFILELGNSKFLSGLLLKVNGSEKDKTYLSQLYNQKNKYELKQFVNTLDLGEEDRRLLIAVTELQGNLIDLDCIIKTVSKYQLNIEIREALDELITVRDYICKQDSDLVSRICVDLTMVPKFDYYEGIIFKGLFNTINKPVLTGGRYDALSYYYGKKVPAMGFSIDLDELVQTVYKEGR